MIVVLMGGACSMYGYRKGAYRILVGKPERKSSHGRPMHRWQENIKIDLREVGWRERNGVVWLRRGTGGGLL